jgi:hypothetical protein
LIAECVVSVNQHEKAEPKDLENLEIMQELPVTTLGYDGWLCKFEKLEVSEASLCFVPYWEEGELEEGFKYPKRISAEKPQDR